MATTKKPTTKKNENTNKLKIKDESNIISDNLKEYYSKVSQKIIKLIQDEKIKEAIKLIDNELEQPYIPHEVILNFLNTKKDLENELKQMEYEKNIEGLTKLQLWDKIYNVKKNDIDIVYLNLWEERFSYDIDEVDFGMFSKIFKDPKVDNINKLHLILMLINLDIDYKFKIYNNKTKKTSEFKPLEIEKKLTVMNDISDELEKFFLQDPSKMEMSLNLLQLLFSYYIPEKIPFTSAKIASSIANVVKSLFGLEKIKANEITKILDDFIKD